MKQIEAVLPHRYPFLFIDRVIEAETGSWAKAVKNVTRNEWFFDGHFPGEPVMPGVLIVEAIAQLSAFAVGAESTSQSRGMIASIRGIAFMAPVVPGDQLVLFFEVISRKGRFLKGRGEATVNGNSVARIDELVIAAKKDGRP